MSNFPVVFRVIDIIPQSDSAESDQNSEPSIAVNPVNPAQMFAGTFGDGVPPFFISTDGGATWSIFGTLFNNDKSIAWKVDGSAVLVATMIGMPDFGPIDTHSAFTQLNHYVGSNRNDQPWIRTGPSNHVYVAFNDLGQFNPGNGRTASVNVSTDGGSNYTTVSLDRVGAAVGQDGPAVRVAVNGGRVYSVFDRWTSTVENSANGSRFNSDLVVVRSDNGGADSFMALGPGGIGITAATHIAVFANTRNTVLTLGQERIAGGDLAIAVDPNNPDHVVVAYTDAPGANGAGIIQLVVTESFNGGATWASKFTTSFSTRSGQPGVAILANGAIGLLYNSYAPAMGDPATGTLSQHLLTTTDDFATTKDVTLASQSNTTPTIQFDPYLGDFFDLTGIGNTFYGIFSASNADDGTNASFTNVTFNRLFTGTPGTSNFQLTDANGNAVTSSIDPFFFAYSILNPSPSPGVTANMVLRNTGNGTYQIYNLGNNSALASYWLGQVGTDWGFVTLGGFNDGDTSNMLLRNSTSGAFQVYNVAPNNNNNITGSASLGTVGLNWQFSGIGNFSSLGETDMILRDGNSGGFQVYDIKNNQITGSAFMGAVGLNWQFSGIGNFSGRGTSDMLLRDANTPGDCRPTTSKAIRSPALPLWARSGWIGSSPASATSAASPAKAISCCATAARADCKSTTSTTTRSPAPPPLARLEWIGSLRASLPSAPQAPPTWYCATTTPANSRSTTSPTIRSWDPAAWVRSDWIGSLVALPRQAPQAAWAAQTLRSPQAPSPRRWMAQPLSWCRQWPVSAAARPAPRIASRSGTTRHNSRC